jgi:sugar transferase (PEP-CTERM system associated)
MRSSPAVSAASTGAESTPEGPQVGEAPLSGGRWTLLVLLEPVLLVMAAAVTLLARSGHGEHVDYRLLVARVATAVCVLQLALYYGDVYGVEAMRSRTVLLVRVGQAFTFALLSLSLVYYLVPGLRLDRDVVLVFAPLALVTVLGWHSVHRWIGGQETLADAVLIIGTGHGAQQIAREVLSRAPLGYQVVGFLGEHAAEVGRRLINPAVIGTFDDLTGVVETRGVTRIVVALEDRRGRLPIEELLRCRVSGVQIDDAPSFYEQLTGKILLSDLRPSWLVFSPGFARPRRLMRASKRLFEFVLASVLLVVSAPLLALLAVAIRLDSSGPVVYRQKRVGLHGRVFNLYKLRTMRQDAEAATGPVWASSGRDARVTRLGRLLRTLRLDELPQLVNVVRGEMSFVGPRPERPHFVEQLRKVIPYYDQRHSARPGITGWAQVKFGYGSTIEDSERKLQFDLYYIKNMSLLLDLAIVVDTVKVMLVGRGAR